MAILLGEEIAAKILLRLGDHLNILCRILTNNGSHLRHEKRIPVPIYRPKIVPVHLRFRTQDTSTDPRLATVRLQILVADPVSILIAAIFALCGIRIVLRGVHAIDKALHRAPTVLDDFSFAKLFPHLIWHNHASIAPTKAHRSVADEPMRSHTWEAAKRMLTIAKIVHPLREKLTGISIERSCLAEYMRICRPAKTLITLRTICRNRKIVGKLPPIDIRNQAIKLRDACFERSRFHLLGDRRYRHRHNTAECHITRGRNGKVAITAEAVRRRIRCKTIIFSRSCAEGIDKAHTIFRHAKVFAIYASAWAIIAARTLAIGIIEHLTWQARKSSPLSGLEYEEGNRRCILAEIHYKRLASSKRKLLCITLRFTNFLDAAENAVACTLNTLPDIRFYRPENLIEPAIHFCAIGREYLATKILVYFCRLKILASKKGLLYSGIVCLAAKN